jgi:hypothetical protein
LVKRTEWSIFTDSVITDGDWHRLGNDVGIENMIKEELRGALRASCALDALYVGLARPYMTVYERIFGDLLQIPYTVYTLK